MGREGEEGRGGKGREGKGREGRGLSLPKVNFLVTSLLVNLDINDIVLETRVLVSRCLEDKNESLGLGLGLGLEEKVLQFFKTFVVILYGSEQFVIRKPLFERTFFTQCTSASVEKVITMALFVRLHRRQ